MAALVGVRREEGFARNPLPSSVRFEIPSPFGREYIGLVWFDFHGGVFGSAAQTGQGNTFENGRDAEREKPARADTMRGGMDAWHGGVPMSASPHSMKRTIEDEKEEGGGRIRCDANHSAGLF